MRISMNMRITIVLIAENILFRALQDFEGILSEKFSRLKLSLVENYFKALHYTYTFSH